MPSSPGWVSTRVIASRRRILRVIALAGDVTLASATLPSYASTRNGSSLLNTAATKVATSMALPSQHFPLTIGYDAVFRATLSIGGCAAAPTYQGDGASRHDPDE